MNRPIDLYNPLESFKGLWLVGARETMPPGSLRRAKGIHHLRTTSLRSREGSTLLYTVAENAYSLYRFNDVRFYASDTILYRDGVSVLTGLDGNRLAFVRMPPTLETDISLVPLADYLFVTGGGLVRKIDTAGAVTTWGIAAPPNGFAAAKATQKSKAIDVLDSQATWTGASATLADEATIKQQGTNSVRMTVVKSTIGTMTKAITVDLSLFGAGETSPDEDYIAVWVRVDNPANIEYLQIMFDLAGGAFSTDYFTRTIFPVSSLPPSSQLISQVTGIASLDEFTAAEDDFIESADDETISSSQSVNVLDRLGQTNIVTAQDTWVRLRIPKASFQRAGSGSLGWDDVVAARLLVKTNSRGTAIVYWDDLKMIGGGGGLMGDYKYHVTFRNSTTGTRSNANPTAVEVTGVERQSVSLTSLPVSSDAQVNQREIWRTVGNGTLFFRIGTVDDNTTTTFTDDVADYYGLDSRAAAEVMENLELPIDNNVPSSTYDDAFGPWNGCMWWTRDSTIGAKGRVYYSPVGRAESVRGFITLSSDDDPTQKGVIWNGNAYVFTEARIFQILGTEEPFLAREIYGAPGTTSFATITPSPYGIIYQGRDGVRIFNGATSELASFEGISVIFHGESAGGISAFEGVVAAYGSDEYRISDSVTTLALDLKSGGWREIGPAASALFFEDDTGLVIASFSLKVVILEAENALTDDGIAIPLDWETHGLQIGSAQVGIVDYLFIEANTGGVSVTPSLILDDVTIALPAFQTTTRSIVEYRIARTGRVIAVRLTASATATVEVFRVYASVYAPQSNMSPVKEEIAT